MGRGMPECAIVLFTLIDMPGVFFIFMQMFASDKSLYTRSRTGIITEFQLFSEMKGTALLIIISNKYLDKREEGGINDL